jgi:hypothetical protein
MVPQLAMDQMPSLTYDRGKEMAWYMEFTERTGIKAYFAEWQYLISNFNYEECYEQAFKRERLPIALGV